MAVLSLKSLPLGYRFRPTDEELVNFYLRRKINGNEEDVRVIREVDVCKWEPRDLPDLSAIDTNDREWFFFCPRDQKYPNGLRSNRATAEGYWKATGKDRKIKNRVCEIGMKKTLVFYEGRAPRGRRTNWVMHEYRATLDELDGTHPGQGAFVLCRLFKKQDERVEDSHSNEVESAISSPTTANSSPEDMQSAQVTPVSGMQAERQPTNSESCQAEDFDSTTPDTSVLAQCHSNSYNANDADDQLAEVTAPKVDPLFEEDMDTSFFYDPILEPKDYKLFSPLHSQMRAELGSSYMHYPVTNDFSNGHNGLQHQYGTNEDDPSISEFLDSVFINSDEYYCEDSGSQKNSAVVSETTKDIGSCSESDPVVAQAQLNPELVRYGRAQAGHLELQMAGKVSLQMETTPGRHRTLISDNNNKRIRSPRQGALSDGSAGDQFDNLSLKESSSHTNAVGSGFIIGTVIRRKTRQPQNQPGTQNIVEQGTAPRRIRLQTRLQVGPLYSRNMSKLSFGEEDHVVKSTVTEERKATEKHTIVAAHATTADEPPQKILLPESDKEVRPKMRSKSNVPKGRDEKAPSVFSKTSARHSVWSSVNMLRVVLVIVLFIIFVGIWRCLKS